MASATHHIAQADVVLECAKEAYVLLSLLL